MSRVGIALGSNVGDRLAHLAAAVAELREIATHGEPFLAASIYRTEPLHCPPGSPWFYNSAVEIAFDGEAFELLGITRAIERRLGRRETVERNCPRVIDLDLLYFGNRIIATDSLIIPHPRLHERRFVLQPLSDIRGDLLLPGHTKNISEMLENLIPKEPPLARVS